MLDFLNTDFFGPIIMFCLTAIGFLILLSILYKGSGIRVIKNNKVGIVEKWWSQKGSLKDSIIALEDEAGYQPEILRGGIHFRSPIMYKVHIQPLVTIPQGKIGYVFARDGEPLPPEQTLGKVVPGNHFQDVKGFLENEGQKGPQRAIIREGTYAFNLAQFIVITENDTYYLPMGDKQEKKIIQDMTTRLKSVEGFNPIIIKDENDKMGIVTVHDGPSLPSGDIIAPIVGDVVDDTADEDTKDKKHYHNNFQNPEEFLEAKGFRGRQYQVLTEGTYFINRLFATVEIINKTPVEIGNAGVVVSYFGQKGKDVSGDKYRHGELVEQGERGVWENPLMPGKYAFNTYAGKILEVPTTNIILKWIKEETGDHQYDTKLVEVGLITKDAFEPALPLSVVIHIDYEKAPLVIQRFGDVKKLVEQTLDPLVSAYFKNVAQQKTLVELIQERTKIQADATEEMKKRFDAYNLELEEVLIGTPHTQKEEGKEGEVSKAAKETESKINEILSQLRQKAIATEKAFTYIEKTKAENERKNLESARAEADKQKDLKGSMIEIQVQQNKGKGELAKAAQDAQKIKILAQAGAEKEARVGIGKAIAIEEQVSAYGGPHYQVTQDVMTKFAKAIGESKIPIVPETVVNMGNGNGDGNGTNALSLLMTLLAMEKLGAPVDDHKTEEDLKQTDQVKKMKKEILESAQQEIKEEEIEEAIKKEVEEENQDLKQIISPLLQKTKGRTLTTKINFLRKKGSEFLEEAVDSETFDEVSEMVDSLDDGTIEEQVEAFLNLVNADQELKNKVGKLFSSLQKIAPKLLKTSKSSS